MEDLLRYISSCNYIIHHRWWSLVTRVVVHVCLVCCAFINKSYLLKWNESSDWNDLTFRFRVVVGHCGWWWWWIKYASRSDDDLCVSYVPCVYVSIFRHSNNLKFKLCKHASTGHGGGACGPRIKCNWTHKQCTEIDTNSLLEYSTRSSVAEHFTHGHQPTNHCDSMWALLCSLCVVLAISQSINSQ